MLVSEAWLKEWVEPKLGTQELADRLTLAGLEVGSIEAAGNLHARLVTALVVEVDSHPNADKLRVCRVDVGHKRTLSIVCGAANARPGLMTVAALVGSSLPDGKTITRAEVRGVASAGMLCSAAELGLEEESTGIIELPTDAPLGVPLQQWLQLDDSIIDLELTPNRGDCLSMRGVAREVAALCGVRMKAPAGGKAVNAVHRDRHAVRLEAADACPRYSCRIIRGIDPKAQTPLWMKERLRRAGIRSLGPCVDVTNYVMIELGQPMHAFDLDRIHGDIIVRYANGRENIELLDGSSLRPAKTDLLIADNKGPLALAGVMGGRHSAVTGETRDILLESAYFVPEVIAVTSRDRAVRSESSHRFERGVDFDLQREALERASELLLGITGGKPGPLLDKSSKRNLPGRQPISLRHARLNQLLGVKVPSRQIASSLRRLGMEVSGPGDRLTVVAPSYRFDISLEADLIEEVARMIGYDKVPEVAPLARLQINTPAEATVSLSRIHDCLVDRDYQEVVTYSFIDSEMHDLLSPRQDPIELLNPIASDMSVMRSSLWPGLIKTLQYNRNRQVRRLKLFETGRSFSRHGRHIVQDLYLAGLVSGDNVQRDWSTPARPVDFFDIKGDIEALLALTGRSMEFDFRATGHTALHPGQSAALHDNDKACGVLGRMHPALEKSLAIDQPVFLFEIRLAALQHGSIPAYQPFSRFPTIQRDLAVVVARDVASNAVRNCIEKHAGELLKKLELFDQYQGEHIDSGKKSLAFTLTLQHSSRTLTDQETENVMKRVIDGLITDLDAGLR
jgi:phenylalanyl-tRNA synthetase beta chain